MPLITGSWLFQVRAFVLLMVRLPIPEEELPNKSLGMVKALPPVLPVVPKIRFDELVVINWPLVRAIGVLPA